MRPFEPIAIVGRACVLPGAHTPGALWDAVAAGRDLLRPAPSDRWRMTPADSLTTDPASSDDRAWSDIGGYVSGFDATFAQELAGDPFGLPSSHLQALDPLVHWVLHTSRAALRDAGVDGASPRVGAILGNLSFPSSGMARFAERVWLERSGLSEEDLALAGVSSAHPMDRFMSGLPVMLLRPALGLGGPLFALDAACASSLYALKLACDRLQDRSADVMLAGAVNRSDDLFIHVGFCALEAMSRTGRSRPFHADADGLVPAEGAVVVALKRLDDAIASGDHVYGVIRGVGLSNDGRGRGLLAPAVRGQVRAIEAAYAMSGLSPADVGLVECHATGTQVGDRTEVQSLAEVYAGLSDVPLGSLKSNLGHLITAAGGAGLLKVLGAMEHGVRPPTLHAEQPIAALVGSPFRLLHASEPWTSDGPRLAALDAFGFGGNNAHVLVEEFTGSLPRRGHTAPIAAPTGHIAVVGLGASIAGADGPKIAAALRAGSQLQHPASTVELPLRGLRFPPKDLEQTLAQQTLVLRAALDALADGPGLHGDRTQVLIGSGSDPEVARYGARWRLAEWGRRWAEARGTEREAAWLAEARDAVIPLLTSAGVVGNMPNIPANRLNSQLDVGGPSYTVSAEELSGLRSLEVAMRALRAHEVDSTVVGAVDLSCEPVHRAALEGVGVDAPTADAAVVFVLERLEDAVAQGHPVWAVLDESPVSAQLPDLTDQLGRSHAADALVRVLAGVLAVADGRSGPVTVETRSFTGHSGAVTVLPPPSGHGRTQAPSTVELSRSLTFLAHPPDVTVPAVPGNVMQTMQAAPALPPASEDAPAGSGSTGFGADLELVDHVPAPAPAEPTHAPSPAPAARPVAAPLAAAPSVAPRAAHPGAAGRLAAMTRQLADIHKAHLAQQAELQARYVAVTQQGLSGLRQAWAARSNAHVIPAEAGRPMPALAAPAPRRVAAKSLLDAAPPVPAQRARAVAPPKPATAPKPAAAVPRAQTKPTAKPVAATKPAPKAPPAAKAKAAPKKGRTASSKGSRESFPTPEYLPTPAVDDLPGPKWDRRQLEILASNKISEVFGPQFAIQDDFPRQVRMPEDPLLLADRVVGLDAEPGSMTTGTIWTESDVEPDRWFMHRGGMPAGILIESGQADLLLISWLGADFTNRGERVYRLLGCQLTYHGGLPRPGETLRYDIHVDGHATQGPVRIFFFHYDCRVDGHKRLSVREGQAGFFTDAELAESGGILWEAATGEHAPDARVDPPAIPCARTSFSREEVLAFASGDGWTTFGDGFENLAAHVDTPRISAPPMLFWDHVLQFDPRGGPWRRGYLRAHQTITPDDWFFDGHFKDDPCMPGTLMFEGCLQAMAFYMAALGFTVKRDGWRFEPVPGIPYDLKCRGQCIPSSKEVIYEVFVEEVHDDLHPVIYADLLCTVDGLKAFHARRVGLQLVPSFPLERRTHILEDFEEPKPVAVVDGFPFGYASLMACAWGKPSDAFGPMYLPFDSGRHVARLPGPPYHFMTRITSIEGPIGGMKAGVTIDLEYDIPPDAWYFDANSNRTMPFCVLLEAALQPCGWIACYVGSALTTEEDLLFRNLDGTGTLLAELPPDAGTLRTRSKLTSINAAGGMIIVSFDVSCFLDDVHVYELQTVFGFFPRESFENQVGIVPTDEDRAALALPSDFNVELASRPARYFAEPLCLPDPMLLMITRVDGLWPEGGKAGLGRIRSVKDIDPREWFFKAHFFADPVQPGSLGIEAMIQTLQFWMIHSGLGDDMTAPRFEALALGKAHKWKYRGQVVPRNEHAYVELDIVEVGEDETGRYAIADGYFWVDGLRIYGCDGLAIRVVDDAALQRTPDTESSIDPSVDAWLSDHCPTWTVPALPAMSMADRIAGAATQRVPNRKVVAIEQLQVHRWLPVTGPTRLHTETRWIDGDTLRVVLSAWREAPKAALSRFEPVATGHVRFADVYGKAPLADKPLKNAEPAEDPYSSGALFHGPAFRYVTALAFGPAGSTATLDAGKGTVAWGTLGQGLLDALTHAIPHDQLSRWDSRIPEDQVGYPWRIDALDLYERLPETGEFRLEARFEGFADEALRHPQIRVDLCRDDRVIARLRITEVLLPKGPIGGAPRLDRLSFLRDREYVPGMSLSVVEDDATTASASALAQSDWLPGTIATLYGTTELDEVAVRDHVARVAQVHPGTVQYEDGTARSSAEPLTTRLVTVADGTARSAGPATFDLSSVRERWDSVFGVGRWPVEDIYYGLIQRFVRRVVYLDPAALAATHGRPTLYLGNHQTAIESLLFSILAGGLNGVNTVTIAKGEHRETWLGKLIAHCFSYPKVVDPEVITFFDRDNKRQLVRIIKRLGRELSDPGKSVMVHVEGTRSFSCRTTPVERMSGMFIDMALEAGAPIVPVRFVGGLPVEPLETRTEFPVGMGQQDIWFGRPLLPEQVSAMPLRERKQVVLDAINGLGSDHTTEEPLPGDAELAERAAAWQAQTGVQPEHAVLLEVLRENPSPTEPIARLLAAAGGAALELDGSEEDAWLGELAQRLIGWQAPE